MIDANITFEQPNLWTQHSRDTVDSAVELVGMALCEYTGMSAAHGFTAVFGATYVRFTPSLVTHALALWGGIRFQSDDVITLPLVIHELGHLFGVRARNKPTKQLWLGRNKLNTYAGSEYPGMHPPSIPKYNIVEQFCNAWEVWAMELYAQDANGITPAADALRAWFGSNMGAWVATAIGG